MTLDFFLINSSNSIYDALKQIEANSHGIIFTIDNSGAVNGLATDGDIRRKLISGVSLQEPISSIVNIDFLWASSTTSREFLLKKLNNKIKIIPLLDQNRFLTGIITRDNLPLQVEEPVYARARAPVRISFGGGGSDLTHYFDRENGAVINSTISLYSHAMLRQRDDDKIIIHSRDIGKTLEAENLTSLFLTNGPFGLIKMLLKSIQPHFGFELFLHSDFPMNSGLGGSAVVSAAVLGCFNQFRRDRWDLHEVAELAYQSERLYLGIEGGWQDQYATVFGGFNFMEFRMEQNIVHPLRIHSDILLELEESLVLCYTRITHDSGNIHKDQRQQMQEDNIRQTVKSSVELTYRMRNQLLRGSLLQFGHSLHQAWLLKRQFSEKISNTTLDGIYARALNHGAVGGKLLGAGGGGFFIFYVSPYRKHDLMNSLEHVGLKTLPFRFEPEGLRTWTTREQKNHLDIET